MSPLVLGEILAVFLNILAANTNYPVKDFENLQLPVQMRLSKQRKSFSQVFVPFLESTLNFKHFEKKDDRHDWCVSEITESENLVRTFSKEPRFTTDFGSQHVKVSQMLAKFPWELFYHVFSSFSRTLIWKISLPVLGEIWGVFVNTLTTDAKYPVQDCENLQLPIQTQLSKKRKTFFEFFLRFLEYAWKFKYFEIKMIVIANLFPKLQMGKNWLDQSLKSAVSEHALTVNMWKRPK